MRVKIFGERNSATNALSSLIQRNCASKILPGSANEVNSEAFNLVTVMRQSGKPSADCEAQIDKIFKGAPIQYQWKHAATHFAITEDLTETFFIFIVKHPLSWVYSLYKNPYHQLSKQSATFAEFYSSEWVLLGRDNLPVTKCRPIDLYSHKLNSYKNFISELEKHHLRWALVKFEDFVDSQEAVFRRLQVNLHRPSSNFIALQESTKDRSKNLEYYKTYYGGELWKNEIDSAIVKNFSFDHQLLSYYGYGT